MKAINKDNKNNIEFTNVEKKIEEIWTKKINNHTKYSKSSYAQPTKKQATTIRGKSCIVKRSMLPKLSIIDSRQARKNKI